MKFSLANVSYASDIYGIIGHQIFHLLYVSVPCDCPKYTTSVVVWTLSHKIVVNLNGAHVVM